MIYLTLEDLILLVERLGVGPVKDLGLLDAAVHRPSASVFGHDAYPTLPLKAAALLHSLTNDHGLVDGQKRLAWLATMVFVDLNGRECSVTQDAAHDLVIEIASGLDDLAVIADRLRLARLDPPSAGTNEQR